MSYRKSSYKKYNRAHHKVMLMQFAKSLFHEDLFPYHYDLYDDYDNYDLYWKDYCPFGYVRNMGEYHQMKVLTLLRSLFIKTAKTVTEEMGW